MAGSKPGKTAPRSGQYRNTTTRREVTVLSATMACRANTRMKLNHAACSLYWPK